MVWVGLGVGGVVGRVVVVVGVGVGLVGWVGWLGWGSGWSGWWAVWLVWGGDRGWGRPVVGVVMVIGSVGG